MSPYRIAYFYLYNFNFEEKGRSSSPPLSLPLHLLPSSSSSSSSSLFSPSPSSPPPHSFLTGCHLVNINAVAEQLFENSEPKVLRHFTPGSPVVPSGWSSVPLGQSVVPQSCGCKWSPFPVEPPLSGRDPLLPACLSVTWGKSLEMMYK